MKVAKKLFPQLTGLVLFRKTFAKHLKTVAEKILILLREKVSMVQRLVIPPAPAHKDIPLGIIVIMVKPTYAVRLYHPQNCIIFHLILRTTL